MSLSSVLADSLARIRNAQAVMLREVELFYSGLLCNVLTIMKNEGYILGFEILQKSAGVKRVKVSLKYYNGKAVIRDLKLFSKPGCRVYVPCSKIRKLYNGLGVSVLSTSRGVLTDRDAVKMRVGGELICGLF